MKWWLSKPDDPAGNLKGTGTLDEAIAQSVILSSVDTLVAWGRKTSMWPFPCALPCCLVEMPTSMTPTYAMARFVAEMTRGTTTDPNVQPVVGTVLTT